MKPLVPLIVVLLMLCAVTAQAVKSAPPVEAALAMGKGEGLSVQWSADRTGDFTDATVRFQIRPDGGESVIEESQAYPVFTSGESHEERSYSFASLPPGKYRAFASFTAKGSSGHVSTAKSLLLDVPEAGSATSLRSVIGSARDTAGSDGPITKIDDTIKPSAKTLGASFIVKGTVKYTNRTYTSGAFTGTELLPLRKARIEIRDNEIGVSELVQTALTDNSGSFAVTVPNNDDGNGTGRDIFIRAIMDSSLGTVQDHFGFVYYVDSNIQNNWPGGTLDFGIKTISINSSGPCNIYDSMKKAYDYCVARGEFIPPKITAVWAVGNQDLVENTTYYYNPEKRIYVLGDPSDPDEFDDDVIMHEYGHAAMYYYSYSSAVFALHDWDQHSNNGLAWSEGWANYFSCAARNSRYFVDHDAASFTDHNIETLNTTLSASKRKEDVEGAVAGALFDIFDAPADGVDNLSNGSGTIWYIFSNYMKSPQTPRFRDFYNGWRAYGYPALDKVDSIFIDFGMTFAGGRVDFPNAQNTVLNRGKSYQIKWSGLNGTNVKIELFDGSSLETLIAASTANDGTYNWVVPNSTPLDDNYYILIGVLPDSNQFDYSDNPFSVTAAPPTLTVNGASVAGSISGIEDEDWYIFTAASGGNYTIDSTAGTLLDGYMQLFGPNSQGAFLQNDDESGVGSMPRITRNLTPGTYYVLMQGFGELDIGTYSVRVTK